MGNDWKRYNIKFISAFAGIIVFLILMNILIDPFDIFKIVKIPHFNAIKPDAGRNQRVTKVISLKLEKRPIDAVFFGSSRVNATISEDYYALKCGGKLAKNLGMNALSHDETIKLVKNVVLIHPEIKTIYIGLDFFRFLEKNKDDKRDVVISSNPKLTMSEFNPVILSFNTTISSINTLIFNLKPEKVNANSDNNSNKNEKLNYFIQKMHHYSSNYQNAEFVEGEVLKFKNFKKEMENKGFKVVYYTNPTHAVDLALIHQMGYMPLFDEWKSSMANNFEYIDFDFINDKTTEPVNENIKYFMEISHASPEMGKIIIDNLIFGSNYYGIKITPDNIEKLNKVNTLKLIEWEKVNPFWISEITKAVKNLKREDK